MGYKGRTEFRATRGRKWFFAGLTLIVLIVALESVYSESEAWVRVVCWLIFVAGLLGNAELAVAFVKLGEAEFQMRHNFRMTVVSRAGIESVSAEKGCPIKLVMKNGALIDVPDFGSQRLDNSLRAWIRAK